MVCRPKSVTLKKVLIVAYYFPPAGGPGVQRWLKFVKYLPAFGIQPVVYIPENPTYPIVDEVLVNEIPEDTIIVRRRISEPYGIASIFSKKSTKKISSGLIPDKKRQTLIDIVLLWIRGNLFIPDARIKWVKPSVSFLAEYLSEHNIDTIVTTGPPHSLHLIGMQLKSQLPNLKWLADFRDPWTTIGYHKSLKLSSWAARRHKQLETQVLQSADSIIVTSKTTKHDFEALTRTPIHVITNGFDEENILVPGLDKNFSIAHIGSFLSDRNPPSLWAALRELVKENRDFANDFRLKLIGAVSKTILASLDYHKLTKYVDNLGYVSHREAIQHQRKSQVLLLIEIDSEETRSIIPGKLFEYMAARRPIIAIGPKDSDFANILLQTNTGSFFQYDQKEAIKQRILELYGEFKTGKLATSPRGLEQYSRRNLTAQLAALLE